MAKLGHVDTAWEFGIIMRRLLLMPYFCKVCELVENQCKCDNPDFDFDDSPISEYDKEFSMENNAEEKKEKAENPVSILIKYIKNIVPEIVVAIDDTTKIIARIPTANYVENFVMSSKKFQTFLKVKFYQDSNIIYGDDAYKAAAVMAASIAISNGTKSVQTYLRVAQLSGVIYYNLATRDKLAVKITPDKVEIIHLSLNDPVFLSTARTAPQVRPSQGNGLEELMRLLPIPEEQQMLFKCHFVTFLLEKYPVPIMGLVKEHGSGKTTITGTIKKIIDPQSKAIEDNTTKLAAGAVDRMVQMSKSYLLGYDNISYIKPAESDDLCRAVTGTSADKRTLFTEDDQTIVTLKRKFIFNGIGFLSDQTDFNSRTIYYSLNDLDTIMSTEDYTTKIDAILPAVLYDIFDIISKAMMIQPKVKKELEGRLNRMADFCVWGESIARTLGTEPNEFMKKYSDVLSQSTTKSSESHALVAYIQEIMESFPKDHVNYYFGMNPTVSEFYKGAKLWAEQEGYDIKGKYSTFPKGTNKVRSALQRIKPYLTELGYHVEISDRDATRSETRGERRINIIRLAETKTSTRQGPQEPEVKQA